jgi:hypothetical protein
MAPVPARLLLHRQKRDNRQRAGAEREQYSIVYVDADGTVAVSLPIVASLHQEQLQLQQQQQQQQEDDDEAGSKTGRGSESTGQGARPRFRLRSKTADERGEARHVARTSINTDFKPFLRSGPGDVESATRGEAGPGFLLNVAATSCSASRDEADQAGGGAAQTDGGNAGDLPLLLVDCPMSGGMADESRHLVAMPCLSGGWVSQKTRPARLPGQRVKGWALVRTSKILDS